MTGFRWVLDAKVFGRCHPRYLDLESSFLAFIVPILVLIAISVSFASGFLAFRCAHPAHSSLLFFGAGHFWAGPSHSYGVIAEKCGLHFTRVGLRVGHGLRCLMSCFLRDLTFLFLSLFREISMFWLVWGVFAICASIVPAKPSPFTKFA